MSLDRLLQITEVGIKSGITLTNVNVVGILSVTQGLTVSGVITATSFSGSGANLTDVGIGSTGSINTSGIITTTSFFGSGANLLLVKMYHKTVKNYKQSQQHFKKRLPKSNPWKLV